VAPVAAQNAAPSVARPRPNILFAIADDWGWPHAGAYGDAAVMTPTFDALAAEGVLFKSAFASSPSCTPSRNAILTGQNFLRLGRGANLWSTLAPEHPVFPLLLEDAGYHVGRWRKAWGPGNWRALGRQRDPAGPAFRDFESFLKERPPGAAFCFWFGSSDPHRGYEKGSGEKNGIDLDSIVVPPPYPDSRVIRSDIADYYWEVQRFDREVGRAVELLRERGELDRTIIVMTGDHGWPFPRGKTNLYDLGCRVPLVVRHGESIAPGQVVESLVSLADLAPTFLEAAGLPVGDTMTGKSLWPLVSDGPEGGRDHLVLGRERHTVAQKDHTGGYPMRALRTSRYLYIRNLRSMDWPAGWEAPGSRPFRDCDNGPTKTWIMQNRSEYPLAFALCFGQRPAEELYDLAVDPWQIDNLAARPEHAGTRVRLSASLDEELDRIEDPRKQPGSSELDESPYFGTSAHFGNGIKVGEVTATSALVWTRLTDRPGPRRGSVFERVAAGRPQLPPGERLIDMQGAMPGARGEVRLSYWPTEEPRRKEATAWEAVDVAADFTRQFSLRGLQPGTRYELQLEGRLADRTLITGRVAGRFQTAPAADRAAGVSFCVITGQEYHRRDHPTNGHVIYRHMLDLAPSFLVHTGDTVYYDKARPFARSVDLARFKWNRIYALPLQREFHRNVPGYFLKDDHDTLKNDCWPGQTYGELTWDRGLRLFREQVPIGDSSFRTVRWGRHLQVWLLEGREFRSPNRQPDGPEKTILGARQKQWLFETLAESDATFRVVISPTPVVGPDRTNKNDNHANSGFSHEGREVRRRLAALDGVIVICGDRHWQYVSTDPITSLIEFSCGPTTDRHAGGFREQDRSPMHSYLNVCGGFLRAAVEVEPAGARLIVTHHDVHGTVLNERVLHERVLEKGKGN